MRHLAPWQEESLVTIQDGDCQTGEQLCQKSPGALASSKLSMCHQPALAAEMASSILDYMNRSTAGRSKERIIHLYLHLTDQIQPAYSFGPTNTRQIPINGRMFGSGPRKWPRAEALALRGEADGSGFLQPEKVKRQLQGLAATHYHFPVCNWLLSKFYCPLKQEYPISISMKNAVLTFT